VKEYPGTAGHQNCKSPSEFEKRKKKKNHVQDKLHVTKGSNTEGRARGRGNHGGLGARKESARGVTELIDAKQTVYVGGVALKNATNQVWTKGKG